PYTTLFRSLQSPALLEYKLALERVIRYKPHTLSTSEERLLAMQTETSQTPRQVFDQLTDADLKFGTLTIDGEPLELSHGSFMLRSEEHTSEVRKTAFHQ